MQGPWYLPARGPRIPLPLSLSLPFHPLPSPPSPYLPLSSLPLEVGLRKSSYGVWESIVSSPAGTACMEKSPRRNRICCISALTSGNNFNDFPENQLTKFRILQQSAAACLSAGPQKWPWVRFIHGLNLHLAHQFEAARWKK